MMMYVRFTIKLGICLSLNPSNLHPGREELHGESCAKETDGGVSGCKKARPENEWKEPFIRMFDFSPRKILVQVEQRELASFYVRL